MRFHRPLDDVLRGRSALAVLRTLTRFPQKEFTGRELADVAGVAPSKAIVELNRLLRTGAVHRRTVGRMHLWRAVEGHFILDAVGAALAAERRVLADLEATLAKGLKRPGVRAGFIHGSVARGDEAPDSDIDVFVVVDREEDKERILPAVAKVSEEVLARYGNPLHVIVYSAAESARKRDLAYQQAARDGIAFIGGAEP